MRGQAWSSESAWSFFADDLYHEIEKNRTTEKSSMLDFPATSKNRDVILKVLTEVYPPEESLNFLELASGSGQHVAYFAKACPKWTLQPSDLEVEHLNSIREYAEFGKLSNILLPKQLDTSSAHWDVDASYDGMWAINLIHISPWEATEGLFRGAAKHLKPDGKLYLYGAYKKDGEHISASNVAFDQSLRNRNVKWGVRCLSDVTKVAEEHGFELDRVVEMPANNLSVLFQRKK